jgi:putative transposase
MARPPKAPNWLPLEQETIYFVTVGVQKREPVLANPKTWRAICHEFQKLDEWKIIALLAMPDHLHLLTAPFDREKSVGYFIRWFTRGFNASYKPHWKWQHGCFDRLLRSNESAQQKWDYIQYNPVRFGLVESPGQWPYQMGLNASPTAADPAALQTDLIQTHASPTAADPAALQTNLIRTHASPTAADPAALQTDLIQTHASPTAPGPGALQTDLL